jgi:Alginate lyase
VQFHQNLTAVSVIILITFSSAAQMGITINEVVGQTFNNSILSSDEEVAPQTFLIDPLFFFQIKQSLKSSSNIDLTFQTNFKELIRLADSFLDDKPHSVTEKEELPPSGDKHDFLALAPYHWPNPFESELVPYIWHDGIINPEINSISDKRNLDRMIEMVATLASSYYFTNEPKYASKAAELLRVWFLDEDTQMNPNLKYGEVIRGKDKVHSAGIMAGSNMTKLLDSIQLIRNSESWTLNDQENMQAWLSSYLDWLLQSGPGKEERKKSNNHGTYYELQVASIALFSSQPQVVNDSLQRVIDSLSEKIKPDGRQPFELRRTNAIYYSVFNLLGLFKLAAIGDRTGIDLWNFSSPEGTSLEKALQYLFNIMNNKTTQYPKLRPLQTNLLEELSCRAILHYWDVKPYIVDDWVRLVDKRLDACKTLVTMGIS